MIKYIFVAMILVSTSVLAQSPQLRSANGKYLGNMNSNQYDPNSVSNPYGRYGSQYSPDSINNPYGRYGSPYGAESVNNPYAGGRYSPPQNYQYQNNY